MSLKRTREKSVIAKDIVSSQFCSQSVQLPANCREMMSHLFKGMLTSQKNRRGHSQANGNSVHDTTPLFSLPSSRSTEHDDVVAQSQKTGMSRPSFTVHMYEDSRNREVEDQSNLCQSPMIHLSLQLLC